MTDEQRKQTDFLNLPPGSEMEERIKGPGASEFATGTRLEIRIDDHRMVFQVKRELLVGRLVEGDSTPVDVDLSPQGAYQSGVSRRHAVIRYHDGALSIEDLRSTNGTRINGSQLTPEREYRLRDGDEIEFARVRTSIRFLHDS